MRSAPGLRLLWVGLLVASCGAGDEATFGDETFTDEADGDALFAAPDCDGAVLCTAPAQSRPQCFAAMRARTFAFESLQTFDVPATASYNLLRLGLRRLYNATDGSLRVEVREFTDAEGTLANATLVSSATLAGALVSRTSGWNTVRFSPAFTLQPSNAVRPRYALVLSVPTGPLAVGVACAESPDALPGGVAKGRKLRLNVDGTTWSSPAFTAGARDWSFALGFSSTPAGPCSSVPGAQCDDGNATGGDGCSASCTLEPGFTCSGVPSTCTDNDECAANTDDCDVHATCTNTPGSFSCACTAGYTGDGRSCTDVDGCAGSPCFTGVSCTDVAAPGTGFSCGACPAGYSGNGTTCADIDGCASSPCFSGVACTDVAAPSTGFTCAACPSGFSGDGATCSDVNECLTNNGGCSAQATCANTVGARTCSCIAGYTGDGVTCADVNECLTNNGGCAATATCTNTPGARTCACNAGYTGDGLSCADVNECLTNNGGCSAQATCANTVGARTCSCIAGFSGDGVTCSDVNECLTNNGGCDANATCTNTTGSRTCACNPGYSGSGLACFVTVAAPTITSETPSTGTLTVAFTQPVQSGTEGITNYAYSTDGGTTFVARSPASTSSPLALSGLATGTYTIRLRALTASTTGLTATGTAQSVFANARVFTYTGASQSFTVPGGVTSIRVEAWGAAGGGYSGNSGPATAGGAGGYARGTLDVSGITTLAVIVGNGGIKNSSANAFGGGGGVGSGNNGDQLGAGGGLSGVFNGSYTFANALLVAGGGGGGSSYGPGGNGGGSTGNQGAGGATEFTGGFGGTQGAGGSFGAGTYTNYTYRNTGTQLQGGNMLAPIYAAAAGGGGYYGGGSGAANNYSGSSGGGGSGYQHPTRVSAGQLTASTQGTLTPPGNTSSNFSSGAGTAVSSGTGGQGRVVFQW